MKTITDQKQIARLLERHRADHTAQPKNRIYKVRNANDVRIVADLFKVDVPTGPGRLPVEKLRSALGERGYKLDVSEYRSGSSDTSRYYEIRAVVREGRFYLPKLVVMTIAQLREHHEQLGRRGRPSHSNIAIATAEANGWSDYTIVSVKMLR